MNFDNRLKKLRSNYNLTQEELAKKVGVSRATIAGYETKGKEPPYETLTKLAKTLDCSIDYLLGHSDELSPTHKIKSALSDDPELANFWDKLAERPDLQLLFKQTKDLSPKAIHQVIRIMKAIEDEEGKNGS